VIPFLQLTPGEDAPLVREAIDRVVSRGWFVLGPELDAFEGEFAAACGTTRAVGVGTGTDALAIALRAMGIGPGDEVITAPLSAAYSALAIMMAGAKPVFADIDPQRLTLLGGWTERRRALADLYRTALAGIPAVGVPPELDAGHVYHLFPVRSREREAVRTHLTARGIETLIHYPIPIPLQPAFATVDPADCPVATRTCAEIFSLPLYPSLSDAAIREVVRGIASTPGSPSSRHAPDASR
jgi:dTDP-4-amino-4,6-dideoxygalactose transaminase